MSEAQQPIQQPVQPQGPRKKAKKPLLKRVWFWLLVVVAVFFVYAVSTSGSSSDSTASTSTSSSTAAKTPAAKTSTSASASASASKPSRDNSTAKAVTLGAGSWTVGKDIQPGRYVIAAVSGTGNLSSTGAQDSMDINEILDASGADGIKSYTDDLTSGMVVKIDGIDSTSFTPATTSESTSLTTGNWTVGIDIPAGSYTATPTDASQSGNFVVYVNGAADTNEILGSDGVKSVHVSLGDGDVVSISTLSGVNFAQ